MQEQQTEKAGALHGLTSFIHVAASMGYPGQRGLGDSGEPSESQGSQGGRSNATNPTPLTALPERDQE